MRVGDPLASRPAASKSTSRLTKLKRTPLHAGAIHALELVVGDLLADEGDALGLAVRGHRAHRPARGCRCRGRSPARSRSCRSRESRAARTASPSARRTACTCAWARTETSPPARTRGNAHRPRPPAACTSASTDWDGTECSRHSSARQRLLGLDSPMDPAGRVSRCAVVASRTRRVASGCGRQTRSSASDTPCPTPTHMVASARLPPLLAPADAPRSARAARPTCRADGRARSRRRSD